MPNLLILITAFTAAVRAAAIDGTIARPTDASIPAATLEHAPEVTVPPSVHELIRRQNAQTVLVGPDNTCGYVNGLSSASFTCGDKNAYCAFITTQSLGAVACCNSAACGFKVDCADYRAVASSACDASCQRDSYTLKCTNTAQPYCATVTFFNGIVDYFCNNAELSAPLQAYTTYSGQTGRTFSPVAVTLSGTPSSASRTTAASGSSSTGASGTDSSVTASGAAASSTSGVSTSSSGTPIGPVVGGVVGGVAVLALIGFGIWFLMRRNRQANEGPKVWNMQQQQPGAGQPYQPQQSPAPAYGAGYYQDPAKSPAMTSYTESNRQSFQPSVMSSTVHEVPSTPVQPRVYEAGGEAVGPRPNNPNHRGQFHELQ